MREGNGIGFRIMINFAMRISTWNVNGIRSAFDKGLRKYIETSTPDILCIQETKANLNQFPAIPGSYTQIDNSANRKGYSGVAVFSKLEPLSVVRSLGHKRFDSEGRYLKVEYPEFTLINVYIPHGGRQFENLYYKLTVYDALLNELKQSNKEPILLVGDLNVALHEIDLARPKQNYKNIMFTTPEREKLEQIAKLGFVDIVRQYDKDGPIYTWWPYAYNARKRNLGWRIDYIWVSPALLNKVIEVKTRQDVLGSDHCPVEVVIAMHR